VAGRDPATGAAGDPRAVRRGEGRRVVRWRCGGTIAL